MNETVMILRRCHINVRYKGYKYIPDAVEIVSDLMDHNIDTIRMTKYV